MSLNCISIGKINKYIFLVLLGSVVYASLCFTEVQSILFESKEHHPIIQLIINSFGLCLTISLLLINKIYTKRKNNKIISQEANPYLCNLTIAKRVSKKEKFLWILLVSGVDFIFTFSSNYFLGGVIFFYEFQAFCILFLSLFSYKILNYKLYKHHYLSIIIISIGFLISLIENFFVMMMMI